MAPCACPGHCPLDPIGCTNRGPPPGGGLPAPVSERRLRSEEDGRDPEEYAGRAGVDVMLLKIEEDERGYVTISRPPFETVFNPDEWKEITEYVRQQEAARHGA